MQILNIYNVVFLIYSRLSVLALSTLLSTGRLFWDIVCQYNLSISLIQYVIIIHTEKSILDLGFRSIYSYKAARVLSYYRRNIVPKDQWRRLFTAAPYSLVFNSHSSCFHYSTRYIYRLLKKQGVVPKQEITLTIASLAWTIISHVLPQLSLTMNQTRFSWSKYIVSVSWYNISEIGLTFDRRSLMYVTRLSKKIVVAFCSSLMDFSPPQENHLLLMQHPTKDAMALTRDSDSLLHCWSLTVAPSYLHVLESTFFC